MVEQPNVIPPLGNTPTTTPAREIDTPDPLDIAGRRAVQEAQRLGRRGYVLVPVTVVRTDDGKKDARFHGRWATIGSSDPAVIRDWSVQYPGCSFAIDCGRSGIEIVDLDLHEGGPAWWGGQEMPVSPVVVDTPTGGEHHYFRRGPVERVINNAGQVAPGVDARTVGGVVFAPGSYVVGTDGLPEERPYVARQDLPEPDRLPVTPARVLALWRATKDAQASAGPVGVPNPLRGFTPDEAAAYVAQEAQAPLLAAEYGTNVNDTLNRSALVLGHFVPAFWSAEDARDALGDWLLAGPGRRNNWTALDQEDIGSIRSGLSRGMAEPYSRRAPLGSNPLPELEPGLGSPNLSSSPDPAPIPLAMLQAGPVGDPLETALERGRINRMVRRILDAEERPPAPDPSSIGLAQLLAEPAGSTKYRIDGLWPAGGKVLMSAGKKAGKTTMIGNLVRCLADTSPFLAAPGGVITADGWKVAAAGHTVAPLDGRRVMIMDFEMTRDMLREWLRDQRIANVDGVRVELMRGRAWDVRDERERERWAAYLASQDVGVLIVDPIGPVLSALGIEESDNTAVGAVLWALDALALAAGIPELFVSHHAGHDGERARGASAFGAWPDAIWELVRDKTLEGAGKRALRAEGRDVYLPETVLEFDRSTRRLSLGEGSRAAGRGTTNAEIIRDIVTAECAERGEGQPGPGVRELKRMAPDAGLARAQDAQDAIAHAVRLGFVHHHPGAGGRLHHHPGASCEGDAQCPKNVSGLAKPIVENEA